jgi:hypothetical protein
VYLVDLVLNVHRGWVTERAVEPRAVVIGFKVGEGVSPCSAGVLACESRLRPAGRGQKGECGLEGEVVLGDSGNEVRHKMQVNEAIGALAIVEEMNCPEMNTPRGEVRTHVWVADFSGTTQGASLASRGFETEWAHTIGLGESRLRRVPFGVMPKVTHSSTRQMQPQCNGLPNTNTARSGKSSVPPGQWHG